MAKNDGTAPTKPGRVRRLVGGVRRALSGAVEASEAGIEIAMDQALKIDSEELIRIVEGKRTANPNTSPRELAKILVKSYARKGAVTGFLSSLPANPVGAVSFAVADVAFMLRFHAGLSACVGYISNPNYFRDCDWKVDALFILLGPKITSRVLREAGVLGAKQTTQVLIRKHLSKETLKALQLFVLKWFGKKVTQRAILAKSIPLVGAVVGGSWNYAEIRIVSRRVLAFHFPIPHE